MIRLPTGPENLVCRAIEAMGPEIGFRGSRRTCTWKRKFPWRAGLGGGSSDAAAAIDRHDAPDRKQSAAGERLMEIAAGLGADVPFFLFGGRALAVNRGDEIYPVEDGPKRTVVVVSPKGIGVSTKDAYQWLSAELTRSERNPIESGGSALCAGAGRRRLSNDFEGPVFSRHPRLGEIRDGFAQARSRRCRAGG